jgi:hypothetical protein
MWTRLYASLGPFLLAPLALAGPQGPEPAAFSAPRMLAPSPESPDDVGPFSLAGDFDGDGRIELLRVDWSPSSVTFTLAESGPGGAATATVFDLAGTKYPVAGFGAEVADLDGDGRADVALSVGSQLFKELRVFFGTAPGAASPPLQSPSACPCSRSSPAGSSTAPRARSLR